MPYCELITTVKVEKKEEMALSHALAKVIETIPGKTENWVMTHIEDEARMAFAGSNGEPSAMVTVKTFGEPEQKYYDLLTAGFCDRITELLGVPKDRIYVVYEPIQNWGWNGQNF